MELLSVAATAWWESLAPEGCEPNDGHICQCGDF